MTVLIRFGNSLKRLLTDCAILLTIYFRRRKYLADPPTSGCCDGVSDSCDGVVPASARLAGFDTSIAVSCPEYDAVAYP